MIFHLVARDEWREAVRHGVYEPPSLGAEGFIHCSTLRQIVGTANAFFRGRRDLLVVCLEESRLTAPLRYEAPGDAGDDRGGERFPHLYGALNLDAAEQVIDFPCGPDGRFAIPAALAGR